MDPRFNHQLPTHFVSHLLPHWWLARGSSRICQKQRGSCRIRNQWSIWFVLQWLSLCFSLFGRSLGLRRQKLRGEDESFIWHVGEVQWEIQRFQRSNIPEIARLWVFFRVNVEVYALNSQDYTSFVYKSMGRYDEKKEEIWLSPMTKAPTPTKMSKGQSDNTNNATKSSIA